MTTTIPAFNPIRRRTAEDSRPDHERADGASGAAESVFEINDLATLVELQPLWHELLAKTPQPHLCQSFEWLELYWRHFGDRQRLRAFCVERGGQIQSLVVLVELATSGGAVTMLPSIGTESLFPVGDTSPNCWAAVLRHLQAELSRRRVLDLRGLPLMPDEITLLKHASGQPLQSQPWSGTTILPRPRSFATYWAGVSPAVRQRVESGEQRLAGLGPVQFVRVRPQASGRIDPEFPHKLYQDCVNITLNDERQLNCSNSVLNSPDWHSFLRDMMPWAWHRSQADLCLLLLGSRPIAFRFHALVHGRLRTIWTGADSEFRHVPLTSVLLHRTWQDSLQRGDHEVDLGFTHPDVARNWNGLHLPRQRIVVGTQTANSNIQPPEEMTFNDD